MAFCLKVKISSSSSSKLKLYHSPDTWHRYGVGEWKDGEDYEGAPAVDGIPGEYGEIML